MKAAIVLMMTATKEQELHELLRSAEIPDEIREEWAEKTIKRAIERGRKKTMPLAWLEWADKWESGEDRTEETALEAGNQSIKSSGPSFGPNGMLVHYTIIAARMLDKTGSVYLNSNVKYKYISVHCSRCADWSVAWVNNNNVSRRVMNAEITKQLDDLINLIESYEPEESVYVKLFNAAETDLEQAVVEIAGKIDKNREDCEAFVKEVLSHGCVNGCVSELIYTDDTVAFYQKHKKDIRNLVKSHMSECWIDSLNELFGNNFDSEDPFCEETGNQNLLAWFGFEEAMRQLADRIELNI